MNALKKIASLALAVVVGAALAVGFLVLYSGDTEAAECPPATDGDTAVVSVCSVAGTDTPVLGTNQQALPIDPVVIGGAGAVGSDGTISSPTGIEGSAESRTEEPERGVAEVDQKDGKPCGVVCRSKAYLAGFWKGLVSKE